VHIISRKVLKQFGARHPDAAAPLDTWYRIAKSAQWRSIAEIRKTYPQADAVDGFTIFNIAGNKYRLIVAIAYSSRAIFIRDILTHAEYAKERWKS
jgi:mRNA interferase HigB